GHHTATLLRSGKVLAAGGEVPAELLTAASPSSLLGAPLPIQPSAATPGAVAGWVDYGDVPKAVPGLSDAIAISVGETHRLALKADGTVWAWGRNGNGQLGNGTTTDASSPVRVSALNGVTAVAAGGLHSLAL